MSANVEVLPASAHHGALPNGEVFAAKDDALQMARARAAVDLEAAKKEAVAKKEMAAAFAAAAAVELEAAKALAAAKAAREAGAMEAPLPVPPVSELEARHGRLEAERAAVRPTASKEDCDALAPLEAVPASAHHDALARLEADNRALRTRLADLEKTSSQRACWMAQRLEQIGEPDETRRLSLAKAL